MKRKPNPPEGYEYVSQGHGSHDVMIKTTVKNEILEKADEKQRAELEELIARFCSGGPTGIPRTKLNGQEGWFPSERAPGKVRLQAFKPWQLRAYGFIKSANGRPTYVITGVDCSKKSDRAKQSVVRSAGSEAYRVSKEIQ